MGEGKHALVCVSNSLSQYEKVCGITEQGRSGCILLIGEPVMCVCVCVCVYQGVPLVGCMIVW